MYVQRQGPLPGLAAQQLIAHKFRNHFDLVIIGALAGHLPQLKMLSSFHVSITVFLPGNANIFCLKPNDYLKNPSLQVFPQDSSLNLLPIYYLRIEP